MMSKKTTGETPTEFFDRLWEAMQNCTTIDPFGDQGRQQLISLLLGQCSDDIRKKLQKLRAEDQGDTEKLIEEAWRVYHNRDSNES